MRRALVYAACVAGVLGLLALVLHFMPEAAAEQLAGAGARGLEEHFGVFCALGGVGFLIVSYAKGEAPAFYGFLHELVTDSTTGRASTKSVGYLCGLAVLCWSFAKVTLATCRRIDLATGGLDPTTVFLAELGVIATLIGIMYGGVKALQAKYAAQASAAQPGDGAPTP